MIEHVQESDYWNTQNFEIIEWMELFNYWIIENLNDWNVEIIEMSELV